MLRRLVSWGLIVVVSVFLAGCDTAEERAQKHFEKGLALLEEGDVDRALIEFRNVFKLNGFHREARLTYAQIQEQRGNAREAYGQYLRLIEQYPEDLEGLRALARMAAAGNDWEEAERHVVVAEKLAPEDPLVQSIRAGLDYRNALRDDRPDTAALAVQVSETLLEKSPDLPMARQVVIDDLLRREEWPAALAAIDAGLETSGDPRLYMMRLGVLERLGRNDEIATQLKEMSTLFPDEGLHLVLVNRYVSQGQLKEAETYLRERAEVEDAAARSAAQLELVSFLAQQIGHEAAIAEIDRILAETPDDTAMLRASRAGLDFTSGNRDAAIAAMEDILKDAEPSEETDRIKIALAKMMLATGNSVGARARVEEVLEHDQGQVDALKLKSVWLIEDDQTGDALIELRKALDLEPRDPEIMTLMAQAHERTGNHELMVEMLSLAVQASNNAPAETMRYAQVLIQDDKLLPAEDVLVAALRVQNGNLQLLAALGNLYIRMEDWSRTQGIIDALGRLGTEDSQSLANELTARKLAGQNQAQELETFLTGLVDGRSDLQAAAAIIRLRVAQGDSQGAAEYTDELLAKDPQNPTLRFIKAGLMIQNGQLDEAAASLESIVADQPEAEQVWMTLYRLYRRQGDQEKVTQVLEAGQAALPESPNLKWAAAGEAERRGDIDGAIAIYEELYAGNSNSLVVANNLASLITSHREDDESLQRAYTIARRLRGTDVPPFQDTYGWIAHRLGNHEEALEYLEPAAVALASEPTVQYHLGEIYLSLGREGDALAQFRKVSELSKDYIGAPLPFMERVETQIEQLSAKNN